MTKKLNSKISKSIAIISAAFIVVVGLLLLLNYFRISSNDPINSKTLELLIDRLYAEPNNQELIQEVRNFDLLARKAFFTSVWQIQTLSLILIISACVFVASLRIYLKELSEIKVLQDAEGIENKQNFYTQIGVLSLVFTIVFLSLSSTYFSSDYYNIYDRYESIIVNQVDDVDDDGIERFSITTPAKEKYEEADSLILNDKLEIKKNESETIIAQEIEEQKSKAEKIAFSESNILLHHNTFRGPWGQGISFRKNIPINWNVETGENIIWQTPIPIHGYNSPVIWQDKMFFSGANDNKRVVYCLDIKSGNILWEREANNIQGSPATPPKTTDDTGLAAASLTVDNERVYAIFGTGDIIAFDFNGNRVWARNLGIPKNHYGHSSSLIVWEAKVFVQYDTQDGSKIMALSTTNGNTVWQTARTDDVSWSSPILAKVDGKYQLVLLSLPSLSAYDISNGKLLWTVDCMSGEVGTSPAFGGGLIYAGNEYAKLVAVDPTNGEIIWEDNYYLPEVSSPVYHDGLLYLATSYAVVACFDAKTGELVWEYDAERGFYSSPVVADGKLYVFDLDGRAYIFKPGKEPILISSPFMGESVYATPVFTDGRMYIRGNKNLYCIGKK